MQQHVALANHEFARRGASMGRQEATEHFEDVLRLAGELKVCRIDCSVASLAMAGGGGRGADPAAGEQDRQPR